VTVIIAAYLSMLFGAIGFVAGVYGLKTRYDPLLTLADCANVVLGPVLFLIGFYVVVLLP
jgi:hypothetical protein